MNPALPNRDFGIYPETGCRRNLFRKRLAAIWQSRTKKISARYLTKNRDASALGGGDEDEGGDEPRPYT